MFRRLFACLAIASISAWCALPPVPAMKTVVGAGGRIYVAGTVAAQVPGAPEGALQPAYTPGDCIAMGFHSSYSIPCQDVFVIRLDPSGTQVEAATYIGGSSMEAVLALQAAADGSVYVSFYSSSIRIGSLGLNTGENPIGNVVLKLDPDLRQALKVLRLPSGSVQDVTVLPDESIAFSTITCAEAGCLPSVGIYSAAGAKIWEKSLSPSQPYTQLFAVPAGKPYLWAATTHFQDNASIPVVVRLRLSDGAEQMRVPLPGLGYNLSKLAATPDGGAVVATSTSTGGFALTSIGPDGDRGATRLFQGTPLQLQADASGVVHAMGHAGVELPTPSQSFRRCALSRGDSFTLGWQAATGDLAYATFLDGGATSIALRYDGVVLARTTYDLGAASTAIQLLNPAEFPEQPPCLNPQAGNFGGPVIFNLDASRQVAPGEFLWIYGSGLGPTEEVRVEMDGTRVEAPRELAGTRVLFDNLPAPIIAVAPSRVLVQAPYAIAAQLQTALRVERDGVATNEIPLEVRDVVPAAIPGQHGAIYNVDWSVNSETNTAKPGDVVTIFVSGAGKLAGITDDAAAVQEPAPTLAAPVTAIIAGSGGQAVTFAGGVAGQLPGLVQVNVRIGYDFAYHGRLQLELWFGPAGTGAMALVELFVR